MADQAVVNASPLILLSRGGHLDLLRLVADVVLVPAAVADEILARGEGDVTAKAVAHTPWIEVVSAPEVPATVHAWALGPGQSSVLSLALHHSGMEAIIDDLLARKCAECLGIPVRATLGIVLVAKRRGTIERARPVMEDLIRSGLYLSRGILDEALRRVGE